MWLRFFQGQYLRGREASFSRFQEAFLMEGRQKWNVSSVEVTFFFLFYVLKQILKRLRTETLFLIIDTTDLTLTFSVMGRYRVIQPPLNFPAIMSHRFVAKWLITNTISKRLR